MNTKRTIIVITIALLALVGGYLVWRTSRSDPQPTPTSIINDATPEVKPGEGKINPDGTVVGGTEEEEGDEVPPGTPVPPKKGENVGVTLSRATVSEDLLTVSGYAETTRAGTCTLTLTKSGQKTLTYTSPAELEVSNVSCNPFRIPLSDFPAKGQWRAVITFTAPNLQGTSNEWVVLI